MGQDSGRRRTCGAFRYPGDEADVDMPPHAYAIRGALMGVEELATFLRTLTTPT